MQLQENSNYQDEIGYTIHVTRSLLRITGVWPVFSKGSNLKNAFGHFTRVLSMSLLCFIMIPCILEVTLREKEPRRRLKNLGPLCNCTMAVTKLCVLYLRSTRFYDCVEHMRQDWKNATTFEHRRVMADKARLGRRLAIGCTALYFGSGFSYRIAVLFSWSTVVTSDNRTIRPLPVSGYYVFFDPQETIAYVVVFSMQFVAGCVQYSVNSAMSSLAALFVLHACGQLKVLIMNMRDLVKENQEFENVLGDKKLAMIVRQQIRIKNFINKVEEIMGEVCLVEVVGCTFILCLLGYYIIMEWEDSNATVVLAYCMLLSSFVLSIFILCFIGELLTDQGLQVFLTSCTLDWYHVPCKTARSLVLLIAASSSPMKITAGKFVDLSLQSFGTIIRTSVAYLNILRTTTDF